MTTGKNSELRELENGRELFESGNYIEAKDIFEALYANDPDNKELQNYLGMVLFKLGLHKEAMDLYKKLLEKVPNFPALHLNLGIIYFKEGLLDLAFEEFQNTLKFSPKNKKANNYLGLIHIQKGEFKEALEKFTITGSKTMIDEATQKLKEAKQSSKEEMEQEKTKGKREAEKVSVKQAVEKVELAPESIMQKYPKGKEENTAILHVGKIAEDMRRNVFNDGPDALFISRYKNLVRISVKDNVFSRLSMLESFSGDINFKGAYKIISKKKTNLLLGDADDPILNVFGNGSLILCLGDMNILSFTINDEVFYIKENHLLAFESAITYENASKNFADGFELVKLTGTGAVVIITENEAISQFIDDSHPLAIKLEYIIGWIGNLQSHIVKGKESLFKRREDSKWVTFKGDGYVFCLVK